MLPPTLPPPVEPVLLTQPLAEQYEPERQLMSGRPTLAQHWLPTGEQ